MINISDHWSEIINTIRIEHSLTDFSFKTWLSPLVFQKYENHVAYILIPDENLGIDYFRKRFMFPFKVAISELIGEECEVEFVLPDNNKSIKSVSFSAVHSLAGLNPRYTFDTFVVGSNNNFAHAASLAVAENPGQIYNPLFLYGGVGLGKTHLMHSIAHFIINQNPDKKIIYVTSEQFTNEVIEAIRNGNNSALTRFRDKYRNIDVLLIDDVQFIIGKESTQEEFFHTFNALHSAGKQIILSSDRPPKDMDVLEERIRSRFEWGLMADIQSPNYETRIAILRKKQEMEGYDAGDDVINYIAENVNSNIRELEGSLNKVRALANLENIDISLSLAKKALKDIISPNEKKIITPEFIINTVAEHFDITPEELKSDKRSRKISYPRQIAMYLCREMTSVKLDSIGMLLGGKDHTTVLHGIKKIESDYADSDITKTHVDLLKKKLNPSD